MFIKTGTILKKRIARQTEKGTAAEGVPAADRGDEENGSGHSPSEADRGKSMNSDDRVPEFRLVRARLSFQRRSADHTPLATSPNVMRAACTEQVVPF